MRQILSQIAPLPHINARSPAILKHRKSYHKDNPTTPKTQAKAQTEGGGSAEWYPKAVWRQSGGVNLANLAFSPAWSSLAP